MHAWLALGRNSDASFGIVGHFNNGLVLFASPNGEEVAGRLYSLMISCKHAGLDPEAYLRDVLQKIAKTPTSRIEELTPWAWAKRNPAHCIA